jgi:beta-phosphoglucomutase-like phosphatase (HAD superfamily)
MMKKMRDKIFYYISNRFDEDGVLVDADEIYEAFAVEFDNGVSLDLIDEVMERFIFTHNLANIQISWEGKIA